MNPWVAIVGRGTEGRLRVVERVCAELRERGLRVGGFLQRPVRAHGALLGWDAVGLEDGARYPLARTDGDPDLCEWKFDPAAVERCRLWATAPALDVSVVEAGVLEARGLGHWDTIRAVLAGPARVAVLSVRPSALARIALELPDPRAGLELPERRGAVSEFVEAITDLRAGGRTT